jgi:hypothetical protein
MGALLESGLVGNIGLKHLKVIKEDTINKWDKLGFLEGLKGHMRENVAQLYENQASHLINEASSTSDTGAFETVVFPIVRRVFSKLLANDIVSVQAMQISTGHLTVHQTLQLTKLLTLDMITITLRTFTIDSMKETNQLWILQGCSTIQKDNSQLSLRRLVL